MLTKELPCAARREISLLLGEYLIGGDVAEATRCTRELESPYYLHELVKQAIVATVDKLPAERKLVMDLFQHLYTEQVLRGNQILQGFERTLERMDDLTLDVPNALAVFREGFVTPAITAGWLPDSFSARCVPMSEVKQRTVSMIDEYFDNGEPGVAEATRCLDEMGMSHLHGQIIKKLCVKAIEVAAHLFVAPVGQDFGRSCACGFHISVDKPGRHNRRRSRRRHVPRRICAQSTT